MKKKVDMTSLSTSSFHNFILYVKKNDTGSTKALRLAHGMCDVHTIYVETLDRPYPTWLTGVPTLVSRGDARAYTGTGCLDTLRTEATRATTAICVPRINTGVSGYDMALPQTDMGIFNADTDEEASHTGEEGGDTDIVNDSMGPVKDHPPPRLCEGDPALERYIKARAM